MALDIYTPFDLYAVMYDERQTVSTAHWLEMFYPNSYVSTQEEIAFDKIGASRKIAPFMLPNEQGKPIYRREGERISSFKPAYTKPKDAVRPTEMLQMQPGELTRRLQLQSPEARYNAEVIRITQFHRNAITRLWDYMGARAVLDGFLRVNYVRDAGLPAQSVLVDFGRDAAHTVTKASGSRWGESGVNIMSDIQGWIDLVAMAEFGGSVQDIVLGAQAAVPFMDYFTNGAGKGLLDTTFRGSEDVSFNRGIVRNDPMRPFTQLGTLGSGTRVWRYTGSFQNDNGSTTPIMDPRDVFLAAPGVDGVKAFGAILDQGAQLRAQDIFTKMWDENDPPARFIMSQSAPLMIPVNPNCTLKARVVA